MGLWKRGMSTQYQLTAKNVAKIERWFGGNHLDFHMNLTFYGKWNLR
jgi:hypothetical protein